MALEHRHSCFVTSPPVPLLLKRAKLLHRRPPVHREFDGDDGRCGKVHASDAAVSDEFSEPQPEAQDQDVFPRMRERDPYRLLGVERTASFEEIQEARNFYFEQYRNHEQSREAIEMAFDSLLKEKMRRRKKYGFRPPKTGRKTDLDPEDYDYWSLEGTIEWIRSILEPSVPSTTIINDGFIYTMLACWAAGTQNATGDPTAPFVVSLSFCVWRVFDKRTKRNPEGPYFGNSAIWGSIATVLCGFVFALLVTNVFIPLLPLPRKFSQDVFGAFVATMLVGCTSIFIK